MGSSFRTRRGSSRHRARLRGDSVVVAGQQRACGGRATSAHWRLPPPRPKVAGTGLSLLPPPPSRWSRSSIARRGEPACRVSTNRRESHWLQACTKFGSPSQYLLMRCSRAGVPRRAASRHATPRHAISRCFLFCRMPRSKTRRKHYTLFAGPTLPRLAPPPPAHAAHRWR